MYMHIREIPTQVFKNIARTKGIPVGGNINLIREKVMACVSEAEIFSVSEQYNHTRRASTYIYYQIEKKKDGDLYHEITKSIIPEKELKPKLNEKPQISFFSKKENKLYIHIAFRGDSKIVRDEWTPITYTPPIFAIIVIHELENILEIRCRKEKIEIIENWISENLGLDKIKIKFTNQDLQKMKDILKAVKNSNTLQIKSGGIASLKISMATVQDDADNNSDVKKIIEIVNANNYEDIAPTFILQNGVRVRGNSEDGTFYIPKHITEEESFLVLSALKLVLTYKAGHELDLSILNLPKQSETRRVREITDEIINEKLIKTKLTEDERECAKEFLKNITLDQQKRLEKFFIQIALNCEEETANKLIKGLISVGLLKKNNGIRCLTCGFISNEKIEDYDECPSCLSRQIKENINYSVVGFIRPEHRPDDIFKPDRAILLKKYYRFKQSDGRDNVEKKESLEDLAEYLFSSLNGINCIEKDKQTSDGEIDRIFENRHTKDKLITNLGLNFRVECKNTLEKTDSKEITCFASKIGRNPGSHGVFVSKSGFTGLGNKYPQSCRETLKKLKDDKIYILPISGEDLEKIISDGKSLVDVLYDSFSLVENL